MWQGPSPSKDTDGYHPWWCGSWWGPVGTNIPLHLLENILSQGCLLAMENFFGPWQLAHEHKPLNIILLSGPSPSPPPSSIFLFFDSFPRINSHIMRICHVTFLLSFYYTSIPQFSLTTRAKKQRISLLLNLKKKKKKSWKRIASNSKIDSCLSGLNLHTLLRTISKQAYRECCHLPEIKMS